MGNLPKNWLSISISEVAEIVSGYGFPIKYQGKKEGDLPFYKVGDISKTVLKGNTYLDQADNYINYAESKEIKAKPIKAGTIVFAKIGEAIKLNRRAILSTDGIVDNNVMGVSVNKDILDNKYAYYYMLTVKLDELSRATTVPSVRKGDVENILIPVPPLSEQVFIVAKLEKLLAKVKTSQERLDKIPLILKRFRQSILMQACTGELTKEWREQNPDIETAKELLEKIDQIKQQSKGFKRKNIDIAPFSGINYLTLPNIPDTWTWSFFQKIGELSRGRSKHRPRNDPKLYGGKYPFIQTGDVARSCGKITSHSQTYNEEGLAQGRLFPTGTLCITIAANIADTGILTYPACFPDSVVGFIPEEGMFETLFAMYFINVVQNDLETFAPATAQKNINLEILNQVPVPVPPIEEQKEIVRRVEELYKIADKIETRYQKARTYTDRLTQSILAKAFRGELVSQDPADEPAAVLLERIRQEKVKI